MGMDAGEVCVQQRWSFEAWANAVLYTNSSLASEPVKTNLKGWAGGKRDIRGVVVV